MPAFLNSMRAVLLLLALIACASASALSIDESRDDLARRYDEFLRSLDRDRIEEGYALAVGKLSSGDPETQLQGLRTLAASQEVDAIAFIVPSLFSEVPVVRIWAGASLKDLVSSHELRRRDPTRADAVVLRPRCVGDRDLTPLEWVIREMLKSPDDGNTHAYAATMIGYLGLHEMEGDLRGLLKSRHPAVSNAATYALDLLGSQTFDELAEVRTTAQAFGQLFIEDDEDRLGNLLLPRSAVATVFHESVLHSEDELYRQLVSANFQRFRELRATFNDLGHFEVQDVQPGFVVQPAEFAPQTRVLKNTFVTLAYANRLILRIKLETVVLHEGRCFIVEID